MLGSNFIYERILCSMWHTLEDIIVPLALILAVLCLHSRDYHQASVAGAGIDDPDDPVLKRRIANGEFLNTPSPPSCKVFIANVSKAMPN